MNKKNLSIVVMMLLLLTSVFSINASACENYEPRCVPDWVQDILDEIGIDNPCDNCNSDDDDDTGDDDTGDDDTGDDDDDNPGPNPYYSPSNSNNNKPKQTTVEPTPNEDPVADSTTCETFETIIGEEIIFDGSNSYDPDGEIVEWLWDLGEGTIKQGEIITFSYPVEGVYFVELKVTDDDGSEDWFSSKIVVTQPNRAPTTPIVDSDKTEYTINEENVFNVLSTDLDGDKIEYYIDWGDGTTTSTELVEEASIKSVSHKWESIGKFTIKVTAIDEKGLLSDVAELEVTVEDEIETSVLNFALVALLTIVLTGILVAFLYLKRRNNKK